MNRSNILRLRHGFTLIELLVVIAIIAILAAILFPVFAQAREKARASTCASNEKQIALGIIQYVQDYDEFYPLLTTNENLAGGLFRGGGCCGGGDGFYVTWPDRVYPYLKSKNVFYCPDVSKGADGNSVDYAQYAFNMYFVAYCDSDTRVAGPFTTSNEIPMINTAKVNSPSNIILITDHREASQSTAGAWSYALNYDVNAYMNYLAFPEVTATNCLTSGINCLADPIDPRHTGGFNAAFADGHVKYLKVNTTAAGEDIGALYGQINSYNSSNDMATSWSNAANATAKPYWDPYN